MSKLVEEMKADETESQMQKIAQAISDSYRQLDSDSGQQVVVAYSPQNQGNDNIEDSMIRDETGKLTTPASAHVCKLVANLQWKWAKAIGWFWLVKKKMQCSNSVTERLNNDLKVLKKLSDKVKATSKLVRNKSRYTNNSQAIIDAILK